MSVVQNDPIISGMLEDERDRCAKAIKALEAKADQYQKGSVHLRKIRRQKRVYSYPFLKYREEGKSVFKHLPLEDLEPIQNAIKKRKAVEEEIKKIKNRVQYLDRLISLSGHKLSPASPKKARKRK